ncbi:hypothetical protein Tamer19_36980 [Cupriavidus sp. TA19]|nr:hypothetical protein [Cupriavidus sp. TA19]GLC94290.1 hypothetical protein Tamer19_36980 [Cupriavidus sp. TA19]
MDKRASGSMGNQAQELEYSGYYKTAVPPPDPLITQTGPALHWLEQRPLG